MRFSEKILLWYAANKRQLPWRNTTDPYKIWLSEIILQQTRVAQGLPYYQKFIALYPNVQDLAFARETEILKSWQGLGYYSRARNLHATAKMVVEQYNGIFPKTYKELLKLKGVGDYTASAIASFCFGEAQPVVDGNVYRVLARYHGIYTPINSSEGIAYFKNLAKELMDAKHIRDYNQGIMEFGALQCVPKNPDCSACPLAEGCKSVQNKTVGILPIKHKGAKARKRYFNYIVPISYQGNGVPRTLLQQRTGKGIWENLYEFPLLETETLVQQNYIEARLDPTLSIKEPTEVYAYRSEPVIHKLSHQHLYTLFWIVLCEEDLPNSISFPEIHNYPVPVLIADFINNFKI